MKLTSVLKGPVPIDGQSGPMDMDGHHQHQPRPQGHERNQSHDHHDNDHSHGTEGRDGAEVLDEVLSTFIFIGI